MRRLTGLATIIAASALLLAACSSGGTPAPASQPAASQPPASAAASPAASAPASAPASDAATACEVVSGGTTGTPEQIKGFSFPTGLSINVGDAITWTNADSAPHTVTFDDTPCTSGHIAGGTSVTVRYTVAGTFPFHCQVHPNMTGTIEVKG